MPDRLKPCDVEFVAAAMWEDENPNHLWASQPPKFNGRETFLRRARVAIAAWNRRADDWLPMESAPKDGTEIWAYTSEGEQRVVHWAEAWGPSSDDPGHDAGWASDCGSTYPGCFYRGQQPAIDQPLRWRPLPSPPEK